MSRNRLSAKRAGARFNKEMADYLAAHIHPGIEPRHLNGTKDRGDITGLFLGDQRIVVECKNTVRVDLAGWAAETEAERINDGALAGLILHKRHGFGNPADQWVTTTVANQVAILTGARP